MNKNEKHNILIKMEKPTHLRYKYIFKKPNYEKTGSNTQNVHFNVLCSCVSSNKVWQPPYIHGGWQFALFRHCAETLL